MPSLQHSRLVVRITGIVYVLIGLALAAGGIWLVTLSGSLYYVFAGVGIVITGVLLIASRWAALWTYAAVLAGTLIWAVGEVGFDWWPLAARGDVIFPLGLWLLTPWITRNLDYGTGQRRTLIALPLWGATAAGIVVLVVGLVRDYHGLSGTIIVADRHDMSGEASSQPAEDWRDYGRTQFGQRYSPLTQNTRQCREFESRLDLPYRRFAGQERPGRNHL
jgi:quinoprotein glucose dehydrogenase